MENENGPNLGRGDVIVFQLIPEFTRKDPLLIETFTEYPLPDTMTDEDRQDLQELGLYFFNHFISIL